MVDFCKRLEMLSCEEQVWEEYTPANQEASPGQTNPDNSQERPRNLPVIPYTKDSNSPRESVPATSAWKSQLSPPTALDSPRRSYRKGDLCSSSETFCPWGIVTQYPSTYVGKKNGERAAPFFEDTAIHENRVWEFFYLYNPAELAQTPLLLVPTYQVQELLDFVNKELDTNLTIPRGASAELFTMGFGQQQLPRARFLGRSTTQKTFEDLQTDIPSPTSLDIFQGTPEEEFLERLGNIRRMSFPSEMGKDKPKKNQRKRLETHKAWGRSLRNVMNHLGITDTKAVVVHPPGMKLVGATVFVSVDIEAYEFDHEVITEVGLATFCREDVAATASTADSTDEHWISFIRGHHLRIRENLWARNHKYVKGCPTKFNFGKSEFVNRKRVASFIRKIIEKASFVEPIAGKAPDRLVRKRPLILLFHDSSQDLKYLKALKLDVAKIDNLAGIADTRDMHQYIYRAQNPTKLATILSTLGLEYRNLHNAGNDAVYTMQAMIGLTSEKARRRDAVAAKTERRQHHFSELDDEGWISSDNPLHDDPIPDPLDLYLEHWGQG